MPAPDPQQAHDLVPRHRLLRARRELRTARKALERAREQLAVMGQWSLEVFPGVDLPGRVQQVIGDVSAQGLSYLTEAQLRSLATCVLETEASGREGILLEAGTARGGSAMVMAAAKAPGRELRVYDVFATIPPPSDRDGPDVQARYADIAAGAAKARGGELYYGYRENLYAEVRESFARLGLETSANRVRLVRGLFADVLHVEEPVALAHVDGDWYESTLTCLERVAPRLVPGGRIVVDDYWMWSGCREAVEEYFAGRPGYRLEMRAKVHVVREPG